MKLLSLQLPENKHRDVGYLRSIDLRHPVDQVLGWTVLVRGPAVILIAPKGHPQEGGWEFARSMCVEHWDSVDPAAYDKITNWTSEPLERAKPEAVPAMDVPAKAVK